MPHHDLFQNLLLWSHVLLGSLALAAGTLAMTVEKGGRLHRKAGTVFAGSMAVVLASAVGLSLLEPNVFLFAIALFSGYLLFTGWRSARVFLCGVGPLDSSVAVAMVLLGAAMIAAGFLTADETGPQARVLMIFGAIGLGFAAVDLWTARQGGVKGGHRIARHIGRMGGAYIASVTAVAVVNLEMLPDLVRWLGPTVLISPLLTWFSARTLQRAAK